jgi:hypothetical protein
MRQAALNLRPWRVLADKGYDAEHNHRLCRRELGVATTAIPLNPRNHGRKWPKTPYRRLMKKRFPKSKYRQRVQAHSGFSRHKRRLGSALAAKREDHQFNELRVRVLTHNLMLLAPRGSGFQQSYERSKHMASDQTVSRDILRAILEQRRIGNGAAIELLERVEPDLVEFVMEELGQIHKRLLESGASAKHTQRLFRRIETLAVVAVLALRQGHARLWQHEEQTAVAPGAQAGATADAHTGSADRADAKHVAPPAPDASPTVVQPEACPRCGVGAIQAGDSGEPSLAQSALAPELADTVAEENLHVELGHKRGLFAWATPGPRHLRPRPLDTSLLGSPALVSGVEQADGSPLGQYALMKSSRSYGLRLENNGESRRSLPPNRWINCPTYTGRGILHWSVGPASPLSPVLLCALTKVLQAVFKSHWTKGQCFR